MKRNRFGTSIVCFMTIGVIALAQGPVQRQEPLTTERLMQAVSRLRGNRIETPNNWTS